MKLPELTGRIARERIHLVKIPRIDAAIVDGYQALGDLSGTVSDSLDELGIAGAVAGSVLRARMPGARVVGQAITLKNARRADDVASAMRGGSRLADIECHNMAVPGDVLVIEGVDDVSSMGSISATIGKRQGEIGAIVAGAVRDVEQMRRLRYPVWSRALTPVTGKHRLESVAVNGPVTIAGVVVSPGDLVVADEVGVCFVPLSAAAEVLRVAQRIVADEARRLERIAAGDSVPELAKAARPRSSTAVER